VPIATTEILIRAFLFLLLPCLAWADDVACHVTYGGADQVLVAKPVDSPYAVSPVAIGSYFLFRIVFQRMPADLASIKIYTYSDSDDGPAPIHQATYPYPPQKSRGHYGFTGLHFVYEPMRDGELQYWCELRR